jgi:hypothetical protein
MRINLYLTALLILFPILASAQYVDKNAWGLFFGRVPNARAEAMGKAYASVDGDLNATFYNPAGLSNISGLEIAGGYARPFGIIDDSYFLHTGAGYRLNQYLQFAASNTQFTIRDLTLTDLEGNELDKGNISTNIYALTLASEPLERLYVGLNMNYFRFDALSASHMSAWYFDLGLIRKFMLLENEVSSHSISLAMSVTNVNSAEANGEFIDREVNEILPVIARYGANYSFTLNKNFLLKNHQTLAFLAQTEYQDLWNSPYHSSLRFGGEITLLELLAIRAGYYNEKIDDLGSVNNKSEIEDFTYGFGLQIPLQKMANVPVQINFDFATFPQTRYSNNPLGADWEKFKAYNLKIIWLINQVEKVD